MFKRIMFGVVGLVLVGGIVAPAGLALAAVHASGTNVLSNGTIYMIANGERRAYTSAGAFLSYGFNGWGGVVQASAEDMALPEGKFIPPRDGKIVCSDRSPDKGTCYLITEGKRSAFVSQNVFMSLGFSFSKAIYGDVSFLDKDADIFDGASQHKSGVLINKNGTIYLVSINGLMGIPSPDVLFTWGYTFADAINANTKDSLLTQSSIVSARQGAQLKPSDTNILDNSSEDVILQSYLDSYPALPTQTVSSPDDVAAILNLNNQVDPEANFKEWYPYLSSASLDLLNKLPTLKSIAEKPSHGLYATESVYPTVTIFEGKQKALASETIKQSSTNYSYTSDTVLVKENGSWKIDFLGTLKREIDRTKTQNPTGDSVTGSGSTNLTIESMGYEDDEVMMNDLSALFLLKVKNNGQTTIQDFGLELDINNTQVYARLAQYQLLPGQSIVLYVPIAAFWQQGVIRQPGQYRTDLAVTIYAPSGDAVPSDNAYYELDNFK